MEAWYKLSYEIPGHGGGYLILPGYTADDAKAKGLYILSRDEYLCRFPVLEFNKIELFSKRKHWRQLLREKIRIRNLENEKKKT